MKMSFYEIKRNVYCTFDWRLLLMIQLRRNQHRFWECLCAKITNYLGRDSDSVVHSIPVRSSHTLCKFDWGIRCVIIFLYVQFWIRLGTVSYRGKKVRTVDSLAVRSVHKSRDTRNCVQNEQKYAICVLVATRLYHKALGMILCALI